MHIFRNNIIYFLIFLTLFNSIGIGTKASNTDEEDTYIQERLLRSNASLQARGEIEDVDVSDIHTVPNILYISLTAQDRIEERLLNNVVSRSISLGGMPVNAFFAAGNSLFFFDLTQEFFNRNTAVGIILGSTTFVDNFLAKYKYNQLAASLIVSDINAIFFAKKLTTSPSSKERCFLGLRDGIFLVLAVLSSAPRVYAVGDFYDLTSSIGVIVAGTTGIVTWLSRVLGLVLFNREISYIYANFKFSKDPTKFERAKRYKLLETIETAKKKVNEFSDGDIQEWYKHLLEISDEEEKIADFLNPNLVRSSTSLLEEDKRSSIGQTAKKSLLLLLSTALSGSYCYATNQGKAVEMFENITANNIASQALAWTGTATSTALFTKTIYDGTSASTSAIGSFFKRIGKGVQTACTSCFKSKKSFAKFVVAAGLSAISTFAFVSLAYDNVSDLSSGLQIFFETSTAIANFTSLVWPTSKLINDVISGNLVSNLKSKPSPKHRIINLYNKLEEIIEIESTSDINNIFRATFRKYFELIPK